MILNRSDTTQQTGVFPSALFFAALRLCMTLLSLSLSGAQAQTPELRIESFGPVRAYAVGTEGVLLTGTIRNVGQAPLPAGTVTARLYNLTGLDYAEGNTGPKLPALEPNASVTYRWKVQPTGPDVALVASLVLESPGQPPIARIAAIPHFAEPPPRDSASVAKAPTAQVVRGGAVLENNRIRARFAISHANAPALFLSARTIGAWRQVGVVLPLAEVLSAEGGQRPWWEVFKGSEFQASTRPDVASLTLNGRVGVRWRATLDFTLQANSSVLDVRLRLAPLRPLKLSGLRLCPFFVGEGSFGAAATETLGPLDASPHTLAAVRWGEVTVGTLWTNAPLYPGWRTAPLPGIEGADYRLLGAEMASGSPFESLVAGESVAIRVRLFALTPSRSVEEARRVAPPTTTVW